ncbi:hypothetical protein [Micromonospora sp. NPDC092111]|uniref:hypothetical protein n=1 Tax=Micromonospora sp. NPDC092111 TaxID=3364289 RepID=UPI003821AE7E
MSAPPRRPHSVRPGPLVKAALCSLVALVLTCAAFLWTPAGQWLDGLLLPRAERGGGYEHRRTRSATPVPVRQGTAPRGRH